MQYRIVDAMSKLSSSRLALQAAALLGWAMLGAALGCSNSQLETAAVRGRVLLDGKPVETGTIFFSPSQGRAARGLIQSDGSFTLSTYGTGDGAVVGPHRVAVIAPNEASQVAESDSRSIVPLKYTVPESSGLLFQVKGGEENDFVVELKSQ